MENNIDIESSCNDFINYENIDEYKQLLLYKFIKKSIHYPEHDNYSNLILKLCINMPDDIKFYNYNNRLMNIKYYINGHHIQFCGPFLIDWFELLSSNKVLIDGKLLLSNLNERKLFCSSFVKLFFIKKILNNYKYTYLKNFELFCPESKILIEDEIMNKINSKLNFYYIIKNKIKGLFK